MYIYIYVYAHGKPTVWDILRMVLYSNPRIDGKVNHHQISRDLLFHLFGDYYIVLWW